MMKKLNYVLVVIISLMFCISSVLAEEAKCDYKTQANLNKLASQVTVSADLKKDENGNEVFEISIHNIAEELYVAVTPSSKTVKDLVAFEVFPSMTKDGGYTFSVDNTTDVIEYKITVRSTITACTKDIYSLNYTKPRKNKFYSMDICKFSEVIDYYYCQEWVENEFTLVDSEIMKKIEEERQSKKKRLTTKCLECEVESRNEARRQKVKLIKKYVIIGIIIGIIVDLIVIVVLIIRARRSEIW